MVEIEKALVLSTGHMPCTAPDFGNIRTCEHEYGYIVFTYFPEHCEEAAEWLKPILHLAHKNNCVLINFDRDVEPINSLTTYKW